MIDADGCIGITRMKSASNAYPYNYAIRVIVTNCYFPLIQWLKEVIGGGVAYHTKYQYKPTWSTVHRYQLTNEKARDLLNDLIPYLIVKRERAELAVTLPTRTTHYMKGGRSAKTYATQKTIHARMMRLNKRTADKIT